MIGKNYRQLIHLAAIMAVSLIGILSFQNCARPLNTTNTALGDGIFSSLSNACVAGSQVSCNVENGTGSYLCGSDPSSCAASSCDPGFTISGNQCVSVSCTPDTQSPCSDSTGSGLKTCTAQQSYGSCMMNSCNVGYTLKSGACVSNSCVDGNVQVCQVNNGTGSQTCSSSAWGACAATTCNSGYHLSGGLCVVDTCTPQATQACTYQNGMGTQTCSAQSLWGSCVLSSCSAGYTLQNGMCVASSCTPNSTQACMGTNGTGTQACPANGSAWGACQLTACNDGYSLMNGQCVAKQVVSNTCSLGTQMKDDGRCESHGVNFNSASDSSSCVNLCASQGVGICQWISNPPNGISQCSFCPTTFHSYYQPGLMVKALQGSCAAVAQTMPSLPKTAISSLTPSTFLYNRSVPTPADICPLGTTFESGYIAKPQARTFICVTPYSKAGTKVLTNVMIVSSTDPGHKSASAACPAGFTSAGRLNNWMSSTPAISHTSLLCVQYADPQMATQFITKFYVSQIPCATGETEFGTYDIAQTSNMGHYCGTVVVK